MPNYYGVEDLNLMDITLHVVLTVLLQKNFEHITRYCVLDDWYMDIVTTFPRLHREW